MAVAFFLLLLLTSATAHADYRLSVWVRTKTSSVTNFNTYNQGTVHEANPVWFYFTVDPGNVVRVIDTHTSAHEITLSGAAKVPTIQNTRVGGGFADSSELMGYIFRSDADMENHALQIADGGARVPLMS
jgi:hypothetical protein